MLRAYCRCNSGHYFVGEYCPLDGWSSSASKELSAAVEQVIDSGQELSMAELRRTGIDTATIERIILIEFGADSAVFDAISPDGYFIKGKFIKLQDLGQHFT